MTGGLAVPLQMQMLTAFILDMLHSKCTKANSFFFSFGSQMSQIRLKVSDL